jgi:hypothetical protein
MTRTPFHAALIAGAALALVAAGCGNSPTAPEAQAGPPPVGIKTPIGAVIQAISVTRFPSQKSDGSDWDLSLIVASRRPDLYVLLTVPNLVAEYVSNVVLDAEQGKTYKFTQPGSSYDGALPQTLPYDGSRRIYVMDEDVGGDDDRVGWITVNLPAAYQDDNARYLDYTYRDSGNRINVRVQGVWLY